MNHGPWTDRATDRGGGPGLPGPAMAAAGPAGGAVHHGGKYFCLPGDGPGPADLPAAFLGGLFPGTGTSAPRTPDRGPGAAAAGGGGDRPPPGAPHPIAVSAGLPLRAAGGELVFAGDPGQHRRFFPGIRSPLFRGGDSLRHRLPAEPPGGRRPAGCMVSACLAGAAGDGGHLPPPL